MELKKVLYLASIKRFLCEDEDGELIVTSEYQPPHPLSDFDTNTMCELSQQERDWIWNKYKYDVWGDPEIRYLDFSVIELAAEEDDLDMACIEIQGAIGQDDGGIAGQYFSGDGNDQRWPISTHEERVRMLLEYISHEHTDDVKPFVFIKK